MTRESILFSFPAVSLLHDPADTPEQTAGLLVLSSSSQPTDFDPTRFDIFLRLQHTPVLPGHPTTDTLIEAFRTLRKTSPTCFTLESNFGDLTIVFPDLHQLIPQDDDSFDIPRDVRAHMTWDTVVAEFESEIDRFVSYQKNSFSLLPGGEGQNPKAAQEAGFASKKAYKETEGIRPYVPGVGGGKEGGRVVLVDESNGEEVGEVGGMLVQSQGVTAGSKDPVEITLPENGEGPVVVRPADYLKDALSPEYAGSSLVQTAATASRLIVTTSSALSSALASGASTFTKKTKPASTPMTFQPSTHNRMHQLHTFSTSAASISAATVGRVSHFAQNAGAKLAGKDKPRDGTRKPPSNPGLLNKSLIAFSTIADGIDAASRQLLASTGQAASTVVSHRYGAEAGQVAQKVTGSVRNVGLVYIDAAGVSRRAVVKGVAKGMVVGKVKGGGEVLVPGQGTPGTPGTPAGEEPPAYASVNQLQPALRQPKENAELERRSPSPMGLKEKKGGSSTWRF